MITLYAKRLLLDPATAIADFKKAPDKRAFEADFNKAIDGLCKELNKKHVALGSLPTFLLFVKPVTGGPTLFTETPTALTLENNVKEVHELIKKNMKTISDATKMKQTESHKKFLKIIQVLEK